MGAAGLAGAAGFAAGGVAGAVEGLGEAGDPDAAGFTFADLGSD